MVFGEDPPEAGVALFRWIQRRDGKLVVGGTLAEELRIDSRLKRRVRGRTKLDVGTFTEWLQLAWQRGRVLNLDLIEESHRAIRNRTQELHDSGDLRSDDPHIIALANVSGARLLYSDDRNLHQDFTDGALIDNPRGKVYSTLRNRDVTQAHRRLMRDAPACG